MGLPHSGQIGIGPSAAMCRALHLRRAAPFWYLPEPALLLMFPSCVFGGLGEIRIRGGPTWLVCFDHAVAITAMAG